MPPTVALATSAFGVGQAALVYGWVFASHQLGAAFAASTAGYLRNGDYMLAFTSGGALSLFAAGLCLFMGRDAPIAGLSRRLWRRRAPATAELV